MKFFFLLIFITPMLITQTCSAEIYQWTDEEGLTHFGDNKDKPTVGKELKMHNQIVADTPPSYKSNTNKSNHCQGDNQILSVKLIGETEKSIYVAVEYFYDGKHSSETEIVLRPISDLYWSHESILAEPGQNTVNIKLSYPMNYNQSDSIPIDQVEVMMRTPRFDENRKKTFTHKVASKIYDIKHTFNVSN